MKKKGKLELKKDEHNLTEDYDQKERKEKILKVEVRKERERKQKKSK